MIALVLLANPQNRRATLFAQACERAKVSAPAVVSWQEFLADERALERALDKYATSKSTVYLRIESPGELFEVDRAMLARGAQIEEPDTRIRPGYVAARDAARLAPDRGRILFPRQWYRGFVDALRAIERLLAERPWVHVLARPSSIITLFDKEATHAQLDRSEILQAELIRDVHTVEALESALRALEWPAVFVKLRHGSSASGVVALRWTRESIRATTSVSLFQTLDETRLYNSLRIQRYVDERDVRVILSWILSEGAVVERWLPKATYDGDNFDLRVVTIAGKVAHTVVRVGRSPMTNLHLGNRRGDWQRVQTRMSEPQQRALTDVVESVAKSFADCHMLGVDVALDPRLNAPTILEANAFGDLLPGVLVDGRDSYESQVIALSLLSNAL